jgi:signal transduction histidine kinase/HAMP domain-containing protein
VSKLKPQQRLSVRLSAAFLALSLGVLLLAATVSYRTAESALRDRLLDRLDAFAREDASELTDWLSRHRVAVQFIAGLPTSSRAAAGDTTSLGIVLRSLSSDVFAVDEVQVLSVPGGRVIYSTDSSRIGDYAVEQLYYLEGRTRTFTQPIYPDARNGHPTLTVATPIRGADGSTRAVFAAHLSLDQMERVISKPQDGVPIDAYLITPLAEFVSAERFGRPSQRRGVHSLAIDSARAGGSGSGLYTDYSGREVIGAWRWMPDQQLALVLESPQDLAFAPARELLLRSLLVGLLAAALLTFGVVAIVRRITEPMLTLSEAAERVAQGDFTAEAEVRGSDEVAMLAVAFNGMTAKLRTLYGELANQIDATSRALNEATESRALLQDVVDNTTTVVLVVDAEQRLRLANERLASLAQLPTANLLGRELEALPGSFGPAVASVLRAASAQDAAVSEDVIINDGKEVHSWQVVAFPVRDEHGTRYATGAVATDLTERARIEEERRERDAGVQQQQRLESLGIMAGGIAHDFNNLLGAILGNVELVRGDSPDPVDVRLALEQIGTAARRAAELTRQMLAYAGRASLRREALDARKVLTDIVPLVRATQSRKIDFIIEGFDEPLWIEADPAQLSQVALNLLTNAAEAIGDANGTVVLGGARERKAPTGETGPGEWIHISVRDSGHGMSADVLAKIFDPFFTTKRDGRGLGLSAVRGIVRSAGGILRVASTPGSGTRFDVYFPASHQPAAAEEQPSTTPTGHRTGVVLVVDDEPALRNVARRALERQGLKVIEAVDGDDGFAKFTQYEAVLSLVMLDITMPGRNGIELLQDIRKQRPKLPAIIASGYDRPDEMAGAQPDDYTRFLQKPFELTTLRELVASMIKKTR